MTPQEQSRSLNILERLDQIISEIDGLMLSADSPETTPDDMAHIFRDTLTLFGELELLEREIA